MNLQHNNFLDGAPATQLYDANYHQRSTLQPQLDHAYVYVPFGSTTGENSYTSSWATPQPHLSQLDHPYVHVHNSSNPSGGAGALDPYTSHLHSPQNLLDEAQQTGFTEAPQPTLNTQENLDAVNNWSIDDIREMALYFYENPEALAIFDLQDQYDPNNDSDDDEEEVGVYGGVNLEHDPRDADPAGTSHAPSPSEGAGPRGRRLKMYEWPSQSDPKMEKRRKHAERQHLQRQKKKQSFIQLENDLQKQRSVVENLRREASWLQQVMKSLKQ
ncbi:uncharacterized protein LOC126998423 [Eriocheir sinensis]|uniref:uncharacterized protein LOC126998423 n=1 Tax=Eriocheir sinensis TaxID=95602 RepID=UPI0021C8B6BC|nr:uncharacterized protein LOC126998423 [Eriocheir sinensis]